uniref:Uncharacterized protein n=1 Tax=viral metagenome TaxID=1070528 RepID=A0A6M3JP54_9ZZZZ
MIEVQIVDTGSAPVELAIDRYALMVGDLATAATVALHVAIDLAADLRESTGRPVMVRVESGRVGYQVCSERGAVYYHVRAVI